LLHRPFEVESAMMEHPAVLDVAVVGKPDEIRRQIVKAFVVLNPRFAPSDELHRELQQHCKTTTAPFKYPRNLRLRASNTFWYFPFPCWPAFDPLTLTPGRCHSVFPCRSRRNLGQHLAQRQRGRVMVGA
jgi:acyl-CoA synthetase (AMP-forming)/AMP-acid ligase II